MKLVPDWFREMVIETHLNQRRHMDRVLAGLSEEHMTQKVASEENFEDILSILRHIGSAQTYWHFKAGHSIGPPVKEETVEEVLARLSENSEKIIEQIQNCPEEQLQIVPPREGGPSIAWAVMRTAQHGIYHSGQIAKLRRVIGAPDLLPDDSDRWGKAVDSLIMIVRRFLEERSVRRQ
ncbi:MAG: DinB family protein [Candidatus Thorarchaeota archaeon]